MRPLALVTGASSGIGFELARCCAEHGYDLLIAADGESLHAAKERLQTEGCEVTAVFADLATDDGVGRLLKAIVTLGRPVELLLANAGHGLGGGFLDQDFTKIQHVIDTNITGTLWLIWNVGNDMRKRGQGRILITGSIAGFIPGTYQAVYNGTKAFVDSFSQALRAELKDTGVSVTCLMPGATQTEFFERAGMMDTAVGQAEKDDPAAVAEVGFKAMMDGESQVIYGLKNKLQVTIARMAPPTMTAEMHRKQAQPGTAKH